MHLPLVQSTSMESFLHGKRSTHCPQDLWPFQSLQSIHTCHEVKWIIITYLHNRHTNVYQTLHEISSHITTRLITTQYFPDIVVCMWKLWLCEIQKLQFCMHLTQTVWINFTVRWHYALKCKHCPFHAWFFNTSLVNTWSQNLSVCVDAISTIIVNSS